MGEVSGNIKEVLPAKVIVDEMVSGAKEAIMRATATFVQNPKL